MIFNMQRFSTHDGDGIRTVVFFKGCTLQCDWCSNPEGISFGYDLMYDQSLCRHFEDCIQLEEQLSVPDTAVPDPTVPIPEHATQKDSPAIFRIPDGIHINRQSIRQPERLRDVCPSLALTVAGEERTAEEIMLEIEKDLPFYRKDGGVTFSGGEPLAQGPELEKLLMECKNKQITVCIETSLHVQWNRIGRCLGSGITFLADLKHTDEKKFRARTGGDSTLVRDNLMKLANRGEHIVIRIPVIPEFNHAADDMKKILDFAASLEGVHEIHLLPYHALGAKKYRMLGLEYRLAALSPVKDNELEPYITYAQNIGLHATIGG